MPSEIHVLRELNGSCQHACRCSSASTTTPSYVKMEKLEIMIRLASDRNIDQVLLEFKEYATEVDVEFVRKVSLLNCSKDLSIRPSVHACIRECLPQEQRLGSGCGAYRPAIDMHIPPSW